METFLVRFPLHPGAGGDFGRSWLATVLSVDAEGVVVSGWSNAAGDAAELTLLIEADDLAAAERASRELLDRTRGLGDALAEPSVGPTSEPIGGLLLGSDLDGMLDRLGLPGEHLDRRPPVRLPHDVVEALGPGLRRALGDDRGIGARVRLGRIWTRQETAPAGSVPWRLRDGDEVGLPVTTRLATLAGVAFQVDAHAVEVLHGPLDDALAPLGWRAFTLGKEAEEWFGSAGFHTVLRADPGRLLLGLFPLTDPIDMVWFQGTTGLGAGVGTEELTARLRVWSVRHGALPVEVGPACVSLVMRRLGPDVDALCAEAAGLCPTAHARPRGEHLRVRDGGPVSFHDLARSLEATRRLTLSWT